MKKQYLQELKDIKKMASIIKNPLKENIMFEDELDDIEASQEGIDDIPQEKPMPEQPVEQHSDFVQSPEQQPVEKEEKPEEQGMQELDKMGEVDQIRRITLDGMRKLADTPEHPQFQALLKIFQLCNKSVEKDDTQQKQ